MQLCVKSAFGPDWFVPTYRYGRQKDLYSAKQHLASNPKSFIVGQEYDASGKRSWWLWVSPDALYKYIKEKTSNFSRNYPSLYEVICEERAVKPYLDLEWVKEDGDDEEKIFENFQKMWENFMTMSVAPNMPKTFLWSKSLNAIKASYHCVVNGVSVTSKAKVRRLVDQFYESLTDAERPMVFLRGKSVIDISVYGEGSQQFRLPWCSKWYPLTLPQPLFSPGLAPCDYWIFLILEEAIRGKNSLC